jgi:hypothetical protein
MAAVYGEITFAHIHDQRYREAPEFKAFQERARIFIIPRPSPATMGQRMEMGLTVRTRKGETLRQDLRYPLMTETEIQQKFQALAGLRFDHAGVAHLEGRLRAIETEKNVDSLVKELELPYRAFT